MCTRTFSSILGLYPLDVSITPLLVTIKNVSKHYLMSPGDNHHWLRATALGQ